MTDKPFRPMLAAEAVVDKLIYPLFASFKLDGIRCTIVPGIGPRTRSGKQIPNLHVRKLLETLPHGLDGEIVVWPKDGENMMQATTSAVMRETGEPEFEFHVFDDVSIGMSFHDRLNGLISRISVPGKAPSWPDFVKVLHQRFIPDRESLDDYEQLALEVHKHEGLILRNPNSPYKQGRSTMREQGMLKLKRFKDAEAVVTSFEELMHNANEAKKNELGRTQRSTAQDGLVPMGTLGALVCGSFKIGTGFTQAQRQEIWNNRSNLIGKLAKYKSQDYGVKDNPRCPVFLGFRDERDL